MGFFLAGPKNRFDDLRQKLIRVFCPQGFAAPVTISGTHTSACIFPALQVPEVPLFSTGDWTAAQTGTFIFDGQTGQPALRAVSPLLQTTGNLAGRDHGHYGIVATDGSDLIIHTDMAGAYSLFATADMKLISNSFLALLLCLDRATLNRQAVHQYVWNGSHLGEQTLVSEIRQLPGGQHIRLSDRLQVTQLHPAMHLDIDSASFQVQIEQHSSRLLDLFSGYGSAAGSFLTALSGGYDSRLILALLRQTGAEFETYVYGNSGDADVACAEDIARGEKFPLQHRQKVKGTLAPREQIQRNLVLFDGWLNEGIIDDGSDANDRLDRSASGRTLLNGSLGEIYRNFYYLPDRTMTSSELVDAFYSRLDPQVFTSPHDLENYRETLSTNIRQLFNGETVLSRPQIEASYPLFRGRHWSARDISLNQRFGPMLCPFLEAGIYCDTPTIPLKFKSAGLFEAAMIRHLDPSLAAYSSSYGYAFASPPPLTHRLTNWINAHRPIWLRRRSYALQQRRKPLLLKETGAAGSAATPILSDLYNLSYLRDPAVKNRIQSVEYLAQTYTSGTITEPDK